MLLFCYRFRCLKTSYIFSRRFRTYRFHEDMICLCSLSMAQKVSRSLKTMMIIQYANFLKILSVVLAYLYKILLFLCGLCRGLCIKKYLPCNAINKLCLDVITASIIFLVFNRKILDEVTHPKKFFFHWIM